MLALVTGASSGIGFELAKELANRGYDLVVAAESERLATAAEHFRRHGHRVTDVRVNLASSDGVEQLWQKLESFGAPLEVACLNAGVGVGSLFWEADLNTQLNIVNLNCSGTVHLAWYVARHMVRRGAGRILFTASIAGEMVAPREAVYAASKAFDLSFAHSLRYELKDTGVTVTALQPGPTDTDFFHRAGMDDTQVGSEGRKESDPADVARQGLDALFDNKDHVYAASLKTKIEGMLANAIPGGVKGAMHEKMAKPSNQE